MLQAEQTDGCSYHIFGRGKIDLVIEMGLGATLGEWWHVAEGLSDRHTVLLYERSRSTKTPRTPENIACELEAVLRKLNCEEKLILLAHSQGGLYAQQFARLYTQRIKGIVLLDPLSARDSEYKKLLTPKEQKMSGFDKSGNLVIMEKLAKLHLEGVIKAIMKNAPPFYYYHEFSQDARESILSAITRTELYTAALQEYRFAHEAAFTAPLEKKDAFGDIPLVLVTHSSEFAKRETMEFGHTTEEFAEKVEQIWQSLMMDYLSFSRNVKYLQAQNSGHFIHLNEPKLIDDALLWIDSAS